MKIALLNRYQTEMSRGAETFVSELSAQLIKRHHEVKILSGPDADNLGKLIRGNYDVVLAMNGRLQGIKASLGRIIGKYKLVITGQSGLGIDDIINVALSKPDAFVGLTDYALRIDKDEKLDWFGWWGRKVRVAQTWGWGTKIVKIPNGVDIAKFNPLGSKAEIGLKHPVVLSVGALAWYKHHERTIEALALLPDVSLLIVGKGEEEENLKTLAKEKLGERFKIMSAPFEDLPKLYRAADLFVLPSWEREAFGIVYIEAMASGLPVVAPDDSPRREIVKDAGIFIETSDPQKYAQAIREALNIKWADVPRKQGEIYSWDNIAKLYEKLFTELLKNQK